MIAPKRHIFFFLDNLLLGLLFWANIYFWKKPVDKLFVLYLLMSLASYLLCLVLSSGSFLLLEQSRRPLRTNLLALLSGIVGANAIILGMVFFFFKPYRDLLVYHTLITGAVALLTLSLIRTLERRYFWPKALTRVLILGQEPYQHLYLRGIVPILRAMKGEILIAVSQSPRKAGGQPRFLGPEKKLVRYISGQDAKELVASGSFFSAVVLGRDPLEQEFLELLPQCYQNGYSVIGIGPFYEYICRKVPLFQVGDSWLVHTSFKRPSPDLILLKRLFDLCLSLVSMVILAPLALLIAMVIKLESRGPVLFIQERTGLYGKTFQMYKFRSMEAHADDSLQWPQVARDRITRMGHFIRKFGLDEIPQLINVLKGEMGFVGPRPARPLVTERHIKVVPFFAITLALRPGITGWAQLYLGTDTGDESLLEKVRYNLYYANRASLLLDIEIVLKTVRIALLRQKPGRAKIDPSPAGDSSSEILLG